MKLQENKKPTELNLGQQAWYQIQDVATGEKKPTEKCFLFVEIHLKCTKRAN